MLEVLATKLFIMYMIFTVMTYGKIFFKKDTRVKHQNNRKRIEELRRIPNKTTEQQKEFINLKYPKGSSFVWSRRNVMQTATKILMMAAVFIVSYNVWFSYIDIRFQMWQTIVLMIIIPIILNMLLKRYNLHQDDILVFFR